MSEFSGHHKSISRSRSRSIKQNAEYTITLSRKKPVFVPKSIKFIRGPQPRPRKFMMDANQWVSMPEVLSQIMVQENSLIQESRAQHLFPPTPETSMAELLNSFELSCYDPDDIMKTEQYRMFTEMISSIFQKNVIPFLLYDQEHTVTETIKSDILANTPAIFILRFIYYLPELLKYEDPESETSKKMQEGIKRLLDFCIENANEFFVLPSSYHRPTPQIPTHGQKHVSKTESHGNRAVKEKKK